MKWIGLLVILFSASASASVRLPEHPCAGRDCSAPMISMVESFFEASAIGDGGLPGVWSGECYHASGLYDSRREQHGVVFLVKSENGEIFFNGSFSFFYEKNPYSDWTLEDAMKQYPDPFRKALLKADGNSIADYSTDDTVWVHFARQNQAGDKLYLISYFGVGHLMTCELRSNF